MQRDKFEPTQNHKLYCKKALPLLVMNFAPKMPRAIVVPEYHYNYHLSLVLAARIDLR